MNFIETRNKKQNINLPQEGICRHLLRICEKSSEILSIRNNLASLLVDLHMRVGAKLTCDVEGFWLGGLGKRNLEIIECLPGSDEIKRGDLIFCLID